MRSDQKKLKRMYADLARVTGRKNAFGGWFTKKPSPQKKELPRTNTQTVRVFDQKSLKDVLNESKIDVRKVYLRGRLKRLYEPFIKKVMAKVGNDRNHPSIRVIEDNHKNIQDRINNLNKDSTPDQITYLENYINTIFEAVY